LAFSSNFFGSITHRGGRDARVPVLRRYAAIVGYADIGGLYSQNILFPFNYLPLPSIIFL
jgi:hypothetical protein